MITGKFLFGEGLKFPCRFLGDVLSEMYVYINIVLFLHDFAVIAAVTRTC